MTMLTKLATVDKSTTEELEAELRELSRSITTDANKLTDDKSYFETVSVELRNRRKAKDERSAQPTPKLVTEKSIEVDIEARQANLSSNLTLKLIAMEAEQARLVIEIEAHKFARQEAEDRLALIAKIFKQGVDSQAK
jgi:hypothetical protein